MIQINRYALCARTGRLNKETVPEYALLSTRIVTVDSSPYRLLYYPNSFPLKFQFSCTHHQCAERASVDHKFTGVVLSIIECTYLSIKVESSNVTLMIKLHKTIYNNFAQVYVAEYGVRDSILSAI